MGGIKNIIQGHINEFLGNKETIASPRREICKKCPLYHTSYLGWQECNSHAYIDPSTDAFSTREKPGYVKGCGCRIEAKITVPEEKCPAGKW